ncbi:MAG: hypothetical protein M1814_001724 [Vezdaea aestivalis]|nr:MAG: hypothetical protein M1814_001724 [Vezdaea aestivalis]
MKNVTILVPHEAQRTLIVKLIKELSTKSPEYSKIRQSPISIVDGSFGKENDFVSLDTVGIDPGDIHIEACRWNIGISRARDGVVLVADVNGLRHDTRQQSKKGSSKFKRYIKLLDYIMKDFG